MNGSLIHRRWRLCQAVSHVVSRERVASHLGTLPVTWLAFVKRSVQDPFFIICEARTGSTMLCDYLNSHPMLSCAYEILNRGQIPCLGICRSEPDLHFYLDTLFKAIRSPVKCGKNHFTQFDEFGIGADHLVRWFPQSRFLVLYRASLLDQFVSLKLAQLTGRWIATCPAEETRQSVTIDVVELSKYAETTSRRYAQLVREPALRGRHRTISYEELVSDANGVFERMIWPFLDVPPVAVATVLRKQNRLTTEECVANLEEVRSALVSSRLQNPLGPFEPEHL